MYLFMWKTALCFKVEVYVCFNLTFSKPDYYSIQNTSCDFGVQCRVGFGRHLINHFSPGSEDTEVWR
jgi:hypothetical protein